MVGAAGGSGRFELVFGKDQLCRRQSADDRVFRAWDPLYELADQAATALWLIPVPAHLRAKPPERSRALDWPHRMADRSGGLAVIAFSAHNAGLPRVREAK